MAEVIVFVLMCCFVMAALWLNSKLLQRQGVVFHEKAVIDSLSARSHRLISEGVRIDQMQYSWEKNEAYARWIDELYEFMDDYEADVAESIAATASANVVAYAGIRIYRPTDKIKNAQLND